MDFGRPGGRPLMLMHSDPDLELGGSVHQIGRVRGPLRLDTGAHRQIISLELGLACCWAGPRVEGRLGPARSRASDPATCMLGRSRFPTYLPSYPVPARRWRKVYTGHTGVSVTGFKDCCCYGFAISNRRKTHKYRIVPFKGPAPAGTYRTLLTSNNNNRSSSSSSRSGNSQSVNLNKTTAPTHSNKVGTHCPASIESAFYRVHTCPEPLYP